MSETPKPASKGKNGDDEVLEAIGRAVTRYGFCPNRISSLVSHDERVLCIAFPPNDKVLEELFSPCVAETGGISDHGECTLDFCQQSQVNFTSVEQRHESPSCKISPCSRIEGRFSPNELKRAVANGASTAWQLHGLKTVQPNHEYMAISHVWSDGTGSGKWPAGEVNTCLLQFFSAIARRFDCQGLWWDTICIPTDKAARVKAIGTMQSYFRKAKLTLVHDCFLRNTMYKDPETACMAILMSPWFSRGWTAVELAYSQSVQVCFKSKDGGLALVDFDELVHPPRSPRHAIIGAFISELRRNEKPTLNGLLLILNSRHTSWARDVPIISALLVGVDIEQVRKAEAGSSSREIGQETVHRAVLTKIATIEYGHLFHNQPTVCGGFSWCPARLQSLSFSARTHNPQDVTNLNIDAAGNVLGLWRVWPIPTLQTSGLNYDSAGRLASVKIRSALAKPDHHLFLIEPDATHSTRALLVRRVSESDSITVCAFVGAVWFSNRDQEQRFTGSIRTVVISYNGSASYRPDFNFRSEPIRSEPNHLKALRTMANESPESSITRDPAFGRQLWVEHVWLRPLHWSVDSAATGNELDDPPELTLLSASKIGDGELILVLLLRLWHKWQAPWYTQSTLADSTGRTPLSWAAGAGHARCIRLLLDSFPLVAGESQPWYEGDAGRRPGMVDYMVQRLTIVCNHVDEHGRSALSWAAINGKPGSVQTLLTYPEVDINLQDHDGKTPLWHAAERGHFDVMRSLLDTGADAARKDWKGWTLSRKLAATNNYKALIGLLALQPKAVEHFSSLKEAVRAMHHESAEMLMRADAPFWKAGEESVLETAVRNGDFTIIRAMIKTEHSREGPATNSEYAERATLMMRDAFLGAIAMANSAILDGDYQLGIRRDLGTYLALLRSLLREYQAYLAPVVNDRPGYGGLSSGSGAHFRAVHIAAIAGDAELVQAIIRTGNAKIDPWSFKLSTPLHLAAHGGHTAVVGLLLQTGKAGVGLKTAEFGKGQMGLRSERTARDIAKGQGHNDIVRAIDDYCKTAKRNTRQLE